MNLRIQVVGRAHQRPAFTVGVSGMNRSQIPLCTFGAKLGGFAVHCQRLFRISFGAISALVHDAQIVIGFSQKLGG
jgi:hypothetical protein